MLGTNNAHRQRMLLLREKKYLLAGIDQATYRQYAIIFAHVRIKEDRIATGIDHFAAMRPGIAIGNAIEHPLVRSHNGIGTQQSVENSSFVPSQRMWLTRRTLLH